MWTPITQDEVAIALSNCNENIMENSTSVHATAVHPYVSMTMLMFVLRLLFLSIINSRMDPVFIVCAYHI